MLASELIRRSLRLINIPGRGARLSGADQNAAFEGLQDLLNSKSVSKLVVPGIRRHFFAPPAGQSIFDYGPGQDLDTDLFSDPAPIAVEEVRIRTGVTLTENEQVNQWTFANTGTWIVGANWAIANGKATASGAGTLGQTLSLVAGISYTVVVVVTQRAGDVLFELNQDGGAILTQTLAGSGTYEFTVSFAGSASDIEFTTGDAGDDLDIESVSIIQQGLDRVSLPDGTDWPLEEVDQRTFNFNDTTPPAGRPQQFIYSRSYPTPQLRLDGQWVAGEILLLDVLVNRLTLTSLADDVPLHDDALLYVQYALADHEAGGYGKALTRSQRRIMDEAHDALTSGNRRLNNLRVDPALLPRGGRRGFNINRGD